MEKKILSGWHMFVEMGAPDLWRLTGFCNGREICPGTPTAMTKTDEGWVITTYSGNNYLLSGCEYPNREQEYLNDIQEAIGKGWKVVK